MTRRIFAAMLMSAFGMIDRALGKKPELGQAWDAWQDGEIVQARRLASEALAARRAPDEAHHLLCVTAFVSGEYESALEHYRAISGAYRGAGELSETVIEAYVHMGKIQEALDYARGGKGVSSLTVRRLEQHVGRPLEVKLTGVATVPFADHEWTEYLPAFDAEINGQKLIAHVDTGGSFLHMGPERAAALGIKALKGGKEKAHLNSMRVDFSHGVAERFAFGGAVLHNVPVDVLSTLSRESDLVIFGTNILEQFLSTMDYPKRRLLLSRRGDAIAGSVHNKMLPGESVRVPFYLWGTHMMFARGSIGERGDLNFFVDSGLMALQPDSRGVPRQASFTSSKRKFKEWGIPDAEIKRGFFESVQPLGLGSLGEDRPLFVTGAAGDTNFGGVRIDGLISHAFLRRYVWTIDFDTREYRFAERLKAP
jgi:Aspartyl protease